MVKSQKSWWSIYTLLTKFLIDQNVGRGIREVLDHCVVHFIGCGFLKIQDKIWWKKFNVQPP